MKDRLLEKALKWIVAILKKRGVPFQISGGFSAHIYGERQKTDIVAVKNYMPNVSQNERSPFGCS